jgi:hypothetical protein
MTTETHRADLETVCVRIFPTKYCPYWSCESRKCKQTVTTMQLMLTLIYTWCTGLLVQKLKKYDKLRTWLQKGVWIKAIRHRLLTPLETQSSFVKGWNKVRSANPSEVVMITKSGEIQSTQDETSLQMITQRKIQKQSYLNCQNVCCQILPPPSYTNDVSAYWTVVKRVNCF